MKKSEKFWNNFGKASGVIIVLSIILTAYFQIFPDNSNIYIECLTYERYAMSPDILRAIESLREKISSDSIRQYVSDFDTLFEKKLENSYELAYYIKNRLYTNETAILLNSYYPDKTYRGYSYFKIYNDGSKPSEKIIVSLPLNGVALITRENEEQYVVDFNKEIKFDELRQNEVIEIAVWSTQDLSYYQIDNIKISDRYGVGSISMVVKVGGILKFIYLNLYWVIYFGTILLVLNIFGFVMCYLKNKSKSNSA